MTPIRTLLHRLRQQSDEREVMRHAYAGLQEHERQMFRAKDCELYQGKVRELVRHRGDLYIYHTDRLSAFDRHVGLVPYKGVILASISEYWFQQVKGLVPTHYLATPHERVLKVDAMEPVRVEVIVRAYLAGSMMRAYQKGVREFCGVALPDGLSPYGALKGSIVTPTSKAEVYEHDEEMSPDELIEQGVLSRSEWQKIESMALRVFSRGQEIYAEKGWILVDTKYEFGRNASGHISLIDEIHTPDSSRLWVAATYLDRVAKGLEPEMFDKENVRRYLMSEGFSGEGDVPALPSHLLIDLALTYLDVAESLLGHELLSEGPFEKWTPFDD